MPTQANRSAAIATPLGDDALLLKSVSIREELGRLFQIDVELTADNTSISFDDLIGQNATIRLDLPDSDDPRYFNGFISKFSQTKSESGFAQYHATLVPWLWFLTRTADCRIFQQMAIPDIVLQVFKDHGFDDVKNSVTGTYPTLDYCVQYRETDFNFVSRLMEHAGIYYHFEHENGKHTLVLCDSMGAHTPITGYDTIEFHPYGQPGTAKGDVVEWVLQKELQTGIYALKDFDFTAPKNDLQIKSNIDRTYAASSFEIYDYPGAYTQTADGTAYAKVRIEELQANYEVARGQATSRGIGAGRTFTLNIVNQDLRSDQAREYLVVSAQLRFDAGQSQSGRGGGQEQFSCSFSAMSTAEIFRAARITPKPLIRGPQTAIVVGTSGEEIYTDQYGRVKLQFHWDRYGKADENASCWVRVSQMWAGKNWGSMHIPRVGQEVIVEFLEGDPDRPIITGRVYNGDVMPPYTLPDEKTKSTSKSNSSKGGQGFNEIRFEDKKGSEQLFIHGEKDQDVRIKNDVKEWVGNDRHLLVTHDQIEHVENNRNETVDATHTEKIGADRNLNIVGKEAVEIGGSKSLTVKGDVIEVFQGNHSSQVTSDFYLKADNIVIEAGTNLTIKVGQSYIAIESGGISIGTSGTIDTTDSGGLTMSSDASATIKSTGAMSIQSQASAEVKAPQASVKGDATVTIKGGTVMIN
jgi:type VI secretion system secreted protein VgrG